MRYLHNMRESFFLVTCLSMALEPVLALPNQESPESHVEFLADGIESRSGNGDISTEIMGSTVFGPYQSASQFLSASGFDGSQTLRLTIFDYDNLVEGHLMGGAETEIATGDAIYLMTSWLEERASIAETDEATRLCYNLRKDRVDDVVTHILTMLQDIEAASQLVRSKIEFFTSGLGSQIAARVADAFPGIGVIIAHNPAAVGFEPDVNATLKLDKDDAEHVQVVHYMDDEYGVKESIGDIDIFVFSEGAKDSFLLKGMETHRTSFTGLQDFNGEAFIYLQDLHDILAESSAVSSDSVRNAFQRKLNRHKRSSAITFSSITTDPAWRNVLPQAYPSGSQNAFMKGNYNKNSIPLPVFPFSVDRTDPPGDYYHLTHPVSLLRYYPGISDEALDLWGPIYPVTAFHIRILVVLESSDRAFMEAKVVADFMNVTDIFSGLSGKSRIFQTEYKPILTSDINKAVLTLPHSSFGTDSFHNNIKIHVRYRALTGTSPTVFPVKEISARFAYQLNPGQSPPNIKQKTLRHCSFSGLDLKRDQFVLDLKTGRC